MTSKKIDHAAIARKIDAIPSICSDGKKAVASLLQEFGYKPQPEREPRIGEVWLLKDENCETYLYALVASKVGSTFYLVPVMSGEGMVGDLDELEDACSWTSTYQNMKTGYTSVSLAYNNVLEFAKKFCP